MIDDQNKLESPIQFIDDSKSTKQKVIYFQDEAINTKDRYAITRTTENGKYVVGKLLVYKFKGIEIYTEINNIILVDEVNSSVFIKEYSTVVDEIAPSDAELRNYVILYYDLGGEESDSEFPYRWESYIGRNETYEALKTNLPIIDIHKTLVLVETVPLKDALNAREFIEYLINANIVPDEIDLDEFEY